MPVDAWRSPPIWGSLRAAKDENRKSSVIDPLLGCRHSGSPPPRRPGLCRPVVLGCQGLGGKGDHPWHRVPLCPIHLPSGPSVLLSHPRLGWGTPFGGRATCAEDSEPSSLG